MAAVDTEREIREIKRRLDLAETRLAQADGRFEFITGQLRDVQLYMHARFANMDDKLDKIDDRLHKMDGQLDKMDTKIDALPRVLAELNAPQRG